MTSEEMQSGMQLVFAIRLREYAVDSYKIKHALERVKEYEDDDFSPSQYTPSRNVSRERLHNLILEVKGYCYAVDDILGLEHGATEYRWCEHRDKAAVIAPEDDVEFGDDGRTPHWYKVAVTDAIRRFSEYLFSES